MIEELLSNTTSPLNDLHVTTFQVFVSTRASFRLDNKNRKLLGCFKLYKDFQGKSKHFQKVSSHGGSYWKQVCFAAEPLHAEECCTIWLLTVTLALSFSDTGSQYSNILMLLRKAANHPLLLRSHYKDNVLLEMAKKYCKVVFICELFQMKIQINSIQFTFSWG